jgi:hypothetical protein
VSGGTYNAATDDLGSILGGCSNETGTGTNPHSMDCNTSITPTDTNTVVGGMNNSAQGQAASISAGKSNVANGTSGAWVGGGFSNTSSGDSSSLSGGYLNTSSGSSSSLSGGSGNTSGGTNTSVLGGLSRTLSTPANESQAGSTKFAP